MQKTRSLGARLHQVETSNVTWIGPDFPVFWKKGQGAWVEDVDQTRYLDMSASFGVLALGHGHPEVVEAVRRQSSLLIHGMGDVHPPEEKVILLEKLAQLLPITNPRITLGTSGTMATEIALKTAMAFTGKPNVLFFEGGYHGLTSGALRVCGHSKFWKPFAPTLGHRTIPLVFPEETSDPAESAQRLERCLTEVRERFGDPSNDVGAIIVEPIQGRGGVRVPPQGFLRGLRSICDEFQVLLILDEIFTGLYRTGARFCCLAEDIEPDIILLGKALGGGLALGVCAGRSDVMNAFGPSQGEAIHTETFLGNPLTMAVAGVVLDVMERDGFSDQVNKRGMQLRTILDQIAQNLGARAAGVVGRGMMLGIPIVDPEHGRPDPNTVSKIVTSSLNQQLILLGGGIHGNVLQFIPPLTINVEELEFLETQLTATLAPWME